MIQENADVAQLVERVHGREKLPTARETLR